MTKKQIEEYEKLAKLKKQYEEFIKANGDICITDYSAFVGGALHYKIEDDEFKDLVKTLVKEKLEIINKKIKEI